uniref:Palmitoyl-protein thioesterase ABHD10, mitochondrial n=1 Tax=Plectus sambesii TaxID=2011161 RepID=A0A914VE87_9BILA
MAVPRASILEKYLHEKKGYSFLRFDYTDHGDSTYKKQTANEPIDERNVLSPFPGPKPLRHKGKKLEFGAWIKDLLQVVDELTEGPLVLIGESFGAWLAILAALERPERIKGIVAISAGVDFMSRWMNKMFTYQEKERLQAGETLWIADHPDGPYAGSKKIVDDSKEFELLTRQGSLNVVCPVHFVHSMQDDIAPYQWMLRLAAKLKSD